MRTVKQIRNKANNLKRKLQNKPVYENFGSKEMQQLDLYIGFLWDYSIDIRSQIRAIQADFFDWCINYTG